MDKESAVPSLTVTVRDDYTSTVRDDYTSTVRDGSILPRHIKWRA